MGEGQHRFHHHDESERRKWQDPEAILGQIGLKPGDVFLDVGCGDGFFTLPAARIVRPEGKVLGIDIDSVALDELREKARREGLDDIELQVGPAEETLVCQQCADFVFFGIDLHDFQDPLKVLDNALTMIKPTGLLVDLDWKKEPSPMGPPMEIRLTERKASEMIARAGFIVVEVSDSGQYHYLILARPAGGTQV